MMKPIKFLANIVENFKSLRNDLCDVLHSCPENGNDTVNDSTDGISGRQKSLNGKSTKIVNKIPFRNFHGESLGKIKDIITSSIKGYQSHSTLDLHGDKDALDKRYRQFVHLHNAQVDSPTPISLEEVIYQVNRMDNSIQYESKISKSMATAIDAMKNGHVSRI